MSIVTGPAPVQRTFIQENTTLNPYRCVKLGTAANEVVAAVDAASLIIGVTDQTADATADNPVNVIMLGLAKLVIASATTKGAALTATTGGKGLATTTDNNYCVGWLVNTTTGTDEIGEVMVNPFMYGTI